MILVQEGQDEHYTWSALGNMPLMPNHCMKYAHYLIARHIPVKEIGHRVDKYTSQPGPLRQEQKQGGIIPVQPAVECPLTTPLRAYSKPRVTISLGYNSLWGCNGTSRIASSTRTNNPMINSSVDRGCSSCYGFVHPAAWSMMCPSSTSTSGSLNVRTKASIQSPVARGT